MSATFLSVPTLNPRTSSGDWIWAKTVWLIKRIHRTKESLFNFLILPPPGLIMYCYELWIPASAGMTVAMSLILTP